MYALFLIVAMGVSSDGSGCHAPNAVPGVPEGAGTVVYVSESDDAMVWQFWLSAAKGWAAGKLFDAIVDRAWLILNGGRAVEEIRSIEEATSDRGEQVEITELRRMVIRALDALRDPVATDSQVRQILVRQGISGERFEELSRRVERIERSIAVLQDGQRRNTNAIGVNSSDIRSNRASILRTVGMVRRLGFRVDEHGRILDEHDRRLDEHGRVLDRHGRVLEHHGQLLAHYGIELDRHGRLLDEFGQVIALHSRQIEDLYRIAEDHEDRLSILERDRERARERERIRAARGRGLGDLIRQF